MSSRGLDVVSAVVVLGVSIDDQGVELQ